MRWSLVVVVLAGCSAIYGLDGVKNDDPDEDHIPSGSDNCPTVYNPDQSDVNSDGVGDACQVCGATDPTDSDGDGIPDQCDGCDNRQPDANGNGIPDVCEHPHDEDKDGIPDFRDNCPSVPNPDQLDTKDGGAGGGVVADGVGDACDDTTQLDRQVFDGFADTNQLWVVVGQGWVIQDDQAVMPLSNYGAFRYAGFAHDNFQITTHVHLSTAGDAEVVVTDGRSPPDQVRVTCSISVSTGQLSISIVSGAGGTGSVTSYPPNQTEDDLRLSASTDTMSGSVTFGCVSGTGAVAKIFTPSMTASWTPGIGGVATSGTPASSTDTVAFDYFDVVTNGL